MSAMKKAKMAALKELIGKMHKLEVAGFMDKPKGPSVDEMADEAEDDIEDSDDLKVATPLAMVQGEVAGSDDDDDEDAAFAKAQKKYMKRSSSEPIKGKTKSLMMAVVQAKPGRMKK